MKEQKMMDYLVEKTHDLIHAPSCCQEAKDAAKAWLDALGTEKEAEASKAFVAELEEDIVPIDDLIALLESEGGISFFGAERAKEMTAHARERKAAGAKYCDCPACVAVDAILEKKNWLL